MKGTKTLFGFHRKTTKTSAKRGDGELAITSSYERRLLSQHNEMSINKQMRSYRYLSCRVAVRARPEENDSPSSLHLGHYLAVAEAKERRHTKALSVEEKKYFSYALLQLFYLRK